MTTAKILVAEDESIVAKDIQDTLKRQGYDVPAIALSGEEAIEKAAEIQPDLVLMDIMLKGNVDGIAAAEQIRDRFNIPVVYLTAYADKEIVERARITEPFGYIIKPFEARELRTNIEIALYKHKAEETLWESEARLRGLFKTMAEGIILIALDGQIIQANPAAEHILGLQDSEIEARNYIAPEWEILRPDGTPMPPDEMAGPRAMKEMRLVKDVVMGVKRPDGTISWINVSAAPLMDEAGRFMGVVGTFADITERKRAEQLLRKERDKAQKYLDIAAVMMVAIDAEQRVGLINKKGCEILGYQEEEILAKNWFDNFLPEGVRGEERAVFEKLVAGEANPPEYFENPILTKNGDERLVAWHNTILRDEKGNVIATLSSGEDITERRQAEEALRESEECFRSIFENSLVGVYRTTPDGRILMANPALIKMLGYSSFDELAERNLEDGKYFAPQYQRSEFIERIEKQGRAVGLESSWRKRDGSTLFIIEDTRVARDKQGNTLYYEGTVEDITERKKAEEKLLEDWEKLKSLASQLTLAEERERRRIATDLHDRISQSLVISKIKLDGLRHSVSPEDPVKVMEEVCGSLGQAMTFDLSSPILHELGFEAAVEVLLAEQIEQKHGIATEFENDGKAKPLDDDIQAILFRNVRELIFNIVKHANANKVKVSVRKIGSQISVSVEDDGVGFDSAKVASISVREGGFGLFSIRERLEQLGGNLEIKSEPGHGCKVVMTAPLKQSENKE